MAEYQKATLSNGITLVAERHTHVRSVSVGVWVKVGSFHEPAAINGISHFIEHMVFKGTEKRTPLEIATVLESLGGDLNAFTDRENTCYHANVLSEHCDIALDVLSDLVINPTFPKVELERERKVLFQELSMTEETPEEYLADLFFKTVWKDQAAGRPIIGTEKTLKKIGRQKLIDFFEENYVPENMVIAVAGNVDFTHLKESCEKFFRFKSKNRKLPIPETDIKYSARKHAAKFDTDQLHLLVGFPAISLHDRARFDALILSFFLGGGMSSRLFQEIREKAGLAYTVDCDFVPYNSTGLFTIYAGVTPKSVQKTLALIGKELEALCETKLSEDALELVKGQIRGSILMSNDMMDVRQESLGRNEVMFGRNVSVEEVITEIDKVTVEGVQKISQRIFDPKHESVVTLSKTKPKKKAMSVFS